MKPPMVELLVRTDGTVMALCTRCGTTYEPASRPWTHSCPGKWESK